MNNLERWKNSNELFWDRAHDYEKLSDYLIDLLRAYIIGDDAILPFRMSLNYEEKENFVKYVLHQCEIKNNYYFKGVDVKREMLNFLICAVTMNIQYMYKVELFEIGRNILIDGVKTKRKYNIVQSL